MLWPWGLGASAPLSVGHWGNSWVWPGGGVLRRHLTKTLAEERACSGGGPEWVEEGRGSSSL